MRSVTVRLEDLKTTILNLGFVGENEHRQIRINCKKFFDEYPQAAVSLTACPPNGEAYPAVIERDGDFVIWTITDSDVIHEGDGEIQLSFTQEPNIGKTCAGKTRTGRSLVPTGDIPEGIDDFLTRAGAALTEIPLAVSEAVGDALEEAKESGDFDGFSPTVTVRQYGGKTTISVRDVNGYTSAEVKDMIPYRFEYTISANNTGRDLEWGPGTNFSENVFTENARVISYMADHPEHLKNLRFTINPNSFTPHATIPAGAPEQNLAVYVAETVRGR